MSVESPLAIQLRDSGVSESDAQVLQKSFAHFFIEAEQLKIDAESIVVSSIDDKEQMKAARETRLKLKAIRTNAEKVRKELKEESLRKGKAIDGMANVIKFLIVPLEEHLEKQEQFAVLAEQAEKDKIKQKREQELAAVGVDPSFYNLADMSGDKYATLLETSKANLAAAKAAEEKARKEQEEKSKAEAEERERVRIENERLKKEAQEKQAALDAERKERERLEAEAKSKAEAEEKARLEAEEKKRQEALAPDKEKLLLLSTQIAGLPMPTVESKEAKALLTQTVEMLSKVSQHVKSHAIAL